MVSNLKFLDKRNDKGTLLIYSAKELSYEIAEKSFKHIKNSRAYVALSKTLPEKYLEIYYKRLLYEKSLSFSSQVTIFDYDNAKKKSKKQRIDIGAFPSKSLLKKVIDRDDLYLYKSKSRYLLSFKKIIKKFYHYFKNNLLVKFHSQTDSFGTKKTNLIGICCREGHDLKKRSDVFWVNGSKINPENILIYYENKFVFDSESLKRTSDYFKNNRIKQLKLWEWIDTNSYHFKNLLKDLRSINPANSIEKWIKKSAIDLTSNVNYWTSFFSEFNISIHIDTDESGSHAIIKQIALNNLDGLSIGRLRSYTSMRPDFAYGTFPNDIFFTWGSESARRLNKTINKIDNIIISGFPYDIGPAKQDAEIVKINKLFKKDKFKLRLMIIDSNHSKNEGLTQVIPTKVMSDFYNTILEWVSKDDEISLVIKPKKSEFFDSLTDINSKYEKLLNQSTRCTHIDNPHNKMPSSYLESVDLVISISTFFPSSLIECIINGSKGLIFDNANFLTYEKDLSEWGQNKVIFSDLNEMISIIKSYKKNKLEFSEIGDWSSHINQIDPFSDSKGHERIGGYIYNLHKSLEKGMSSKEAIQLSNSKYSQQWGENKVFQNIYN